MLRHHPKDEHLTDYATGGLHHPGCVLVASHLALCPSCRDRLEALEAIGGAMLDTIEPATVADNLLDRALAEIERRPGETMETRAVEPAPASAPAKAVTASATDFRAAIPRPLRDFLPRDLDDLPWVEDRPGIERCDLPFATKDCEAALFRVHPDVSVPEHSHTGDELVMVLSGTLTDSAGEYRLGDVAVADETVVHAPKVPCGEACVCFAVIEGGLHLRD